MSRIMPALSDGRCFTSWAPSCEYDQILQHKYNTPSDASYRAYLQEHALEAQDDTRKLTVVACAYPFMESPAPTTGPLPAPYSS